MLPAAEAIAIYDHLVTALQAIFATRSDEASVWNTRSGRPFLSAMPKTRTYRYSIEIKDAEGLSVLFTVADWDEADRRIAVSQILRLDGVVEVNDFATPSVQPKRGTK